MGRDRSAAVAWWHGTQALIADRVEPVEHGTLVRASEFPGYYDYNCLRVGESEADAITLMDAAHDLLGDLGHRKIQVDHEATGRRLRADFRGAGWRTNRIAWMSHSGPAPDVTPPAADLVEVARPDIHALRMEWAEEGPFTLEQTLEFVPTEDAVAGRLGARLIGARRHGGLVGFVQWCARDAAAEVMLAYVTPSARNVWIGGALVAEAAKQGFAEGAERVFIAADDEQDARRLYERLGFEAVWVMHEFTLELRS